MEKHKGNSPTCYTRLKALAKHNDKYDFVIEERENVFVIYKESNFLNLNTELGIFKAFVFFDHDKMVLKTKLKTYAKGFIIIFYVFILTLSFMLLRNGDFSFLLFVLVAIIASINIPITRLRFKKHVENFLNNI